MLRARGTSLLSRTGSALLRDARRPYLMKTADELKRTVAMEEELAKVLPDNLKSIVEHGVRAACSGTAAPVAVMPPALTARAPARSPRRGQTLRPSRNPTRLSSPILSPRSRR